MAWEAPFVKISKSLYPSVQPWLLAYTCESTVSPSRISISIFHLLISLRYSVFHCVGFVVVPIESGFNVDQKHWLLFTSFLSYRYGTKKV
jgi:hypothetical protein